MVQRDIYLQNSFLFMIFFYISTQVQLQKYQHAENQRQYEKKHIEKQRDNDHKKNNYYRRYSWMFR
jgi:hypothetical protein